MPGPRPEGQKTKLALAIAEGVKVAKWALDNQVPRRTAYSWAKQAKIKADVEDYRRRMVDEAINLLASHATLAAGGIVELAKNAESESVKLRALRAILSDMIAASRYSGLEHRVNEVEEQLCARTGSSDQTG